METTAAKYKILNNQAGTGHKHYMNWILVTLVLEYVYFRKSFVKYLRFLAIHH